MDMAISIYSCNYANQQSEIHYTGACLEIQGSPVVEVGVGKVVNFSMTNGKWKIFH